jgi:hypothetical protein
LIRRFAVVRDLKNETGVISTDTVEWRRGFQCGISPEIGDPGGQNIKAILPLTKPEGLFEPVLTFNEFSGEEFTKWRKFDINMLSLSSNIISFPNVSTIDIINIKPVSNQLRFSFGDLGDIEVCYSGWKSGSPQTLRISVNDYCKTHFILPEY